MMMIFDDDDHDDDEFVFVSGRYACQQQIQPSIRYCAEHRPGSELREVRLSQRVCNRCSQAAGNARRKDVQAHAAA